MSGHEAFLSILILSFREEVTAKAQQEPQYSVIFDYDVMLDSLFH
jgi:hypothetical protein